MNFEAREAIVETNQINYLNKVQKLVCKWFKINPQKYFIHTVVFKTSAPVGLNEVLMFENGYSFITTRINTGTVTALSIGRIAEEKIIIHGKFVSYAKPFMEQSTL